MSIDKSRTISTTVIDHLRNQGTIFLNDVDTGLKQFVGTVSNADSDIFSVQLEKDEELRLEFSSDYAVEGDTVAVLTDQEEEPLAVVTLSVESTPVEAVGSVGGLFTANETIKRVVELSDEDFPLSPGVAGICSGIGLFAVGMVPGIIKLGLIGLGWLNSSFPTYPTAIEYVM
ncbi:MAG: hypothetical protein ABEK50_15710, partial [bacterium]